MVLADLHSAAASADLAQLRQHWWLNKHRINGYNRDKQTPLHLACINGHADVVQFLVEKKCKLNPCDKLKKSPLMKAVEHQHRDCAAILLEHGANHNHRDVSGNTALHCAVMVSSKSLVELLLEHSADINAKNKLGYTPLTLAITENREEMIKFLLQKGADVNAQDNVLRTPLTIASIFGKKKAIKLLLQHGAVFPMSDKRLYQCQPFTKTDQNDAIAKEQIGSSCYETTPVIPLDAPSMKGPCKILRYKREDNKAEEAEKMEDKHSFFNPETDLEDQGKGWASVWLPAANRNRLDARSAAVEYGKDVLPAAAAGEAKKEECDSSWGSKRNNKVLDKAPDTVLLPADVCRMLPEPSVAKDHGKGAWQAAGAAKEKDSGFLCNPKYLSDLRDKAVNLVQHSAGKRSRVGKRSVADKRGKGVLEPAGRAEKKEDADSPWDSKTDLEDQGKGWASAWLSAANSNRLDARSAAVEYGKDVLPAAAAGEAKEEECDSSWGSKSISEILAILDGEQHPVADHKGAGLRSAAAEGSKGVLQPVGGTTEDDDSPWDSEVPFLKESTASEDEGKMSASAWLPAANNNRLDAHSAAVVCSEGVLKQARREVKKEDGVLQPAGGEAKQEDNDFPRHFEVKVKVLKASANVQLPVADQNSVGVSSAAVECDKAAREEQKEHFISSSENKGDLQLKVDSSTQTDSEQDEQLKNLKEPLNKNGYYPASGKNVLKEKKVLTILRNIQSRLADSSDSSAAAIPQLEEHIHRLQIETARLEATIQQQAKTFEVFEQSEKALTSDSSVDTSLWHRDFPHTIKNWFGMKFLN